jgi:predicted dehydrogenase
MYSAETIHLPESGRQTPIRVGIVGTGFAAHLHADAIERCRDARLEMVCGIENLDEFCRKWKITELALFGSVLRADFRPSSDIDVSVSFEPQA